MTKMPPARTDVIDFSAMICLYKNNVASEVREALNSTFVDQTCPPTELVAVFDGPVPADVSNVIDDFEKIVAVKRVVFEHNKGHGQARAAAVAASSHPWMAVVDSDDISLPVRFEKLLEVVKNHPECAVVGGALTEFYIKDGDMVMGHNMTCPQTPDEVRDYIKSRSPVAHPTALLRVEALLSVGNYQTWYNNEDYHLWIRLVKAGHSIRSVPDTVLLMRTNPEFYNRRGGFKYWWNESSLQWFSLKQGTTTLPKFVVGVGGRFVVQVLLGTRLREIFYTQFLRQS